VRLNLVVGEWERELPGTNSISRPQMPFTFGTYGYQRQQVTSGRMKAVGGGWSWVVGLLWWVVFGWASVEGVAN